MATFVANLVPEILLCYIVAVIGAVGMVAVSVDVSILTLIFIQHQRETTLLYAVYIFSYNTIKL